MHCLAIIPARGGSKGIPRKNVRLLAGKPLLAHSIEHARQTPAITRIVVSTDDSEIAAVATEWEAEVVWRPAEISGDTASSESALLHTLQHLESTEQYRPDLVVFLQATSPFRRPNEIADAIATLQSEGADSLFSAGPVHGFVWRNQGGNLTSFSYDFRARPRRQDAPEDLIENGSIYVFKPAVLLATKNRLGGKIAVHRMRALESFQIDEPEDLALLEHLMSFRTQSTAVPDLSGIRLLVLDFDGVFTDNRVWTDVKGNETVVCNRSDGWGLARLLESGVAVLVLSTETVPVAAARCQKLGIPCVCACTDKLATLQKLAQERGLTTEQIGFVGNDVNDLSCLQWVGLPIVVADGYPQLKRYARWITHAPGGHGAVREICDQIVAQQRKALWPNK